LGIRKNHIVERRGDFFQKFWIFSLKKNMTDLLKLQAIDKDIFSMQATQKRLPEQLRKKQVYIQNTQKQLETEQEKLKKKRVLLHDYEVQLKQIENEIEKLESHSLKAKNNQEYASILANIANQKQKKDELELQILAQMEDIDVAMLDIEKRKENIQSLKNEYEQFEKDMKVELQSIEEQLKEKNELREKQKQVVQEKKLQCFPMYERLASKDPNTALMPIQDKACGFCHMVLTIQEMDALQIGHINICKSCSHLMYLPVH
jgi:predicted  nucleic acid-binding Zn-ribbon protein